MIRYFLGAIIALSVSLGLFYFMNFLISGETTLTKGADEIKRMDFIRVKHEELLEAKKRVLPKEPKLKEEPPKPKIQSDNTEIIEHRLDIDMPKPDISIDIANDALSGVEISQNFLQMNSGIAVNLMPIFKIPPRYPNRAKMLKKEGFVVLEFTINKDGFVEDIVITKSKPKKIFDKSAIRALSKWKFKPKIVAAKAVEQRARQTIEYKLK